MYLGLRSDLLTINNTLKSSLNVAVNQCRYQRIWGDILKFLGYGQNPGSSNPP